MCLSGDEVRYTNMNHVETLKLKDFLNTFNARLNYSWIIHVGIKG